MNRQTINWRRLGTAVEFYRGHGCTYVETPWSVPEETAEATMPADARPLYMVTDWEAAQERADRLPATDILVGSAEQGFLAMMQQDLLAPGLYVSCSPCFRDDEPDELRFKNFMKVELIEVAPRNAITAAANLLHLAKLFARGQHLNVTVRDTEIGQDLVAANNIEVGSYGWRAVELDGKSYTWAYGTGLAEPRFSQALAAQGGGR